MEKMNKLVVINQSAGYLIIDVVNAYQRHYSKVVLITGAIGESERSLSSNIKIDKIIKYNKKSSLKRVFTWLVATLQIFIKILLKYRNYEVVYFTNPPTSYFVSSFFPKQRFSIVIYDLYPNALRTIDINEANFIYKMWAKKNIRIFSKAEKIITLGEGMKIAASEYVDASKIRVVYNWPLSNEYHPICKKDNKFIINHNLEGKFIVLYSGNMGYTHDVDKMIEVADLMRDNLKIAFVFIGDGQKKKIMQMMVKEKNLKNCFFYPYQPMEVLPYSLGAADIGVITLDEASALVSVPSKTYNLLAVGAPLLCIAKPMSEMYSLIEKYGNGKCFENTNISEMRNYIEELYENNERYMELRRNSLKASKDFTYKNAELYV